MPDNAAAVNSAIDEIYRTESRRIFATLVRLLGDFDLAEEAVSDAFTAAVRQWPNDGIPANPRAWLVSTGRFKAIDTIRRRGRFDDAIPTLASQLADVPDEFAEVESDDVQDDRLRLIFTCCNPALSSEARIALTLREVCGLTTEEIARAYLTTPSTLAQRIVRAKAKIRDAGIPYEVPERDDLPDRLETVLQVIYLVFNEGYSPSFGTDLTRPDISREAIRLARLLYHLLPDPEVGGLLALMLLHESRRDARSDDNGDIVLLEDQDRAIWDRALITEGSALVQRSFQGGEVGSYSIQAAISSVHANTPAFADTDWSRIVGLYDLLMQVQPGPVVELNRAVAVSMVDGPEAGMQIVDQIHDRGELTSYHLSWAAKGEFSFRMDQFEDAARSWARARDLAQLEPEKRFFTSKIEHASMLAVE